MLIPPSVGTKGGTDPFWHLSNAGALHFLASSRFPQSPSPCRSPRRAEAAHTAATGVANVPSSGMSSASLGKSVRWEPLQHRSGKSELTPSSAPPRALQGINAREKVTKERKQGSLGMPGGSKMPGYQLGGVKYTNWP